MPCNGRGDVRPGDLSGGRARQPIGEQPPPGQRLGAQQPARGSPDAGRVGRRVRLDHRHQHRAEPVRRCGDDGDRAHPGDAAQDILDILGENRDPADVDGAVSAPPHDQAATRGHGSAIADGGEPVPVPAKGAVRSAEIAECEKRRADPDLAMPNVDFHAGKRAQLVGAAGDRDQTQLGGAVVLDEVDAPGGHAARNGCWHRGSGHDR